MPRQKKGYSGAARGEVAHDKHSASVQLDSEEALILIRHIAEALTYSDEVIIEPHWGRRGGKKRLHRVDVRSV